MKLTDRLKEGILLMDGAMGTYYHQAFVSELEAEEANLRHPEQIRAIHREYIEAGAELIRTNTFAVNHHLFPERDMCRAAIHSAVSSAETAAAESGRDVFVGASLGPIRQSGNEEDDELEEEYRFLADAFLEEGIRIFVLETFSEPKWPLQIAGYCKKRCPDSVVIAQFSLNPMGYTQHGYGIEELIRQMYEAQEIDVFGFNCGVGALHIRKLLEQQSFPGECFLSILPNAGYQQEFRGRMRYRDEPEYYGDQMEKLLALGADVIGGCCGTTPAHIAALNRKIKTNRPGIKKIAEDGQERTRVSRLYPTEFIEKLEMGRKVFVVELDAPFDAGTEKFCKGVYALKENQVDMITVSDSPLARSRADASLLAAYAKSLADVSVMPHVAMRDRNLIGLRSQILGAHVNGIRDFLVITGDPVGPEGRGRITDVFDMNSIRFMKYLQHMNEEVFGEYPVFYGGALNYAGVNIQAVAGRMREKMAAGCSYFLTQPVFSEEDVCRIRELKAMTGARILCGLMPLVSYRNALFMQNEMPGIHVNEEILSRYRPDMTREEAEETAVSICLETAEQLYDVTEGFYLMTPFHRVGLVNRIIAGIRRMRQ